MAATVKKATTSLKIPEVLYDDFKITCIRSKMSLQEVVERSLYLYMTNDEFRKQIYNQINVYYTGSDNVGSIK